MRRLLTSLSACATLVVGAALAISPATAGPPGSTGSTGSAAASGAAAMSGTSALPAAEVTLITGDRVQVTHEGGRTNITTVAAARGDGAAPVAFSTFVMRGDTFVVPSDAGMYAGTPLDWSLFDVSALIRGGYTDGATLPLTVTYTTGARARTIPGLAGTADQAPQVASEPPASAATFGQALARQLQSDASVAHGGRASGTSLFAGIRSIALDSTTAHAVNPSTVPDAGFNMQTLTLNAVGRDGKKPSSRFAGNDGYFLVEDLDDPSGFAAELPMVGTQKWSVPAGTYDIRAFIFTWFQKTITFTDGSVQKVWDYNMSFIWQPQVSIAQDTALTFDARTANEIPTVATPDADTGNGWRTPGTNCCDPQFELVTDRVAPDGYDLPWYWESGAHALAGTTSSLEMFAAPTTAPVTEGKWHFYTYQRLESPSTGHVYDLVYPDANGVPASFATKVTAAQLAAIPTTYTSEVPGRVGSQVRYGYQPWETINTKQGNFITEPMTRTEYVLATPATSQTLWQESAAMSDTPQYPAADNTFGPYTSYTTGPQTPVQWFDGPRHVGVEQPGAVVPPGVGADAAVVCPVCRTADSIGFNAAPNVDGTSGEWGPALDTGNLFAGTQINDSETLDETVNGQLAAQYDTADDPDLGSGPTMLAAAPAYAQYRIDYTVDRSTPWSSLSTAVTTRWDFGSTGPAKSDKLPSGWSCGALTGACSLLPLLLMDYNVPVDEHEGVQAPGTVNFTVHVYHQPHATTTATVDVPSVAISYDDGTTWQQVEQVSPVGGGTFRVTMTTPDPQSITGFVSLRVGDADSAGSDVEQTIIRAFTLAGSAASSGAGVGQAPPPGGGGGGIGFGSERVCAAAAPGQASCDALVRTNVAGQSSVTPAAQVDGASPPDGYGPADLASAYHLSASGGAGQTVAVVDAAGDPNIVDDIAAYRAEYGLPACTTDSGCLRVVNETGTGAPTGSDNQNWGVETALDMDMVSATCPNCHLLLVVADTSSFADLATAEETAATLDANVISNSYGAYEGPGMQQFVKDYKHPGVAIVASSGDSAFGMNGTLGGTQFPASLPSVTAVGGTRLTRDATSARGWSETAWNLGGSGCSAYFAKPAYQADPNCHMRTVADVSAVADPNTGVAVYDSALTPTPGWLVVGGTSVAAPLIAGVYGLADNASTAGATPAHLYKQASRLNDITSGSNGYCGSLLNYLCNAGPGYDAPTGLGTPNGTGAF